MIRTALRLVTLALLTSGTAEAGQEWMVWRQFGNTWAVVPSRGVWASANECDARLPHYALNGVTLLVDNHVPGWCCLPMNPDPRNAKGKDALIVAVSCPGFPVDLREFKTK
jgi:hypothetical protein